MALLPRNFIYVSKTFTFTPGGSLTKKRYMSSPTALVQNLWNYCNILHDDGLSCGIVKTLESVVSASFDRTFDNEWNPQLARFTVKS